MNTLLALLALSLPAAPPADLKLPVEPMEVTSIIMLPQPGEVFSELQMEGFDNLCILYELPKRSFKYNDAGEVIELECTVEDPAEEGIDA